MNLDTRTVLLQALVKGDSYGLELIERVRKMTYGKITVVQGRVYPALRAMEQDGLLESYDGESISDRGGRPRRYYRLTAEGLRAAKDEAKAIAGLLGPLVGALR